jgi:hypothetical protein
MTTSTDQKRVFVTRPVLGICHMQVCAVKDATDAEILEACNSENPSGTENGWMEVIRTGDPEKLPGQCSRYADRLHFLVVC